MNSTLRFLLIAAGLALPLDGAAGQPEMHHPEVFGPQISVTGEGIVRARPDMALITLGVVSEAATAGEALSENSRSMAGIQDALEEAGLESRDLQTSGFFVEPIYSQPPRDYDGSQPFIPEIVGYRVRNELMLRVRDLERLGTLLDQVIALGANSVSGPTFTVADPTPLEDQARRAAMRSAMRKAELYAEAAGVALGPILRIEETAFPPQPLPIGAAARLEAADSSVPIQSGELAFQAQVSVAWRLSE
jgi:uncharacterized protein YggE